MHRDEVIEQLSKFDISRYDQLTMLAEALAYANTGYTSASEPIEQLPRLQARGFEVRDQLLVDATALVKRGLLDGRPLEELKKGPGYMNMTADLGTLMRLLRDNWSTIATKTAIQLSELDEAEELFQKITQAYVDRQKISAKVTAAADERQRAYTLVVEAYDDARRAISFLRWKEGDVEKIAPSLYANRGQRTGSAGTSADPGNAAPVAGTATVPPTHAAGDPVVAPPAPAVATQHAAAPGMPNGNPFTN